LPNNVYMTDWYVLSFNSVLYEEPNIASPTNYEFHMQM